MSRRSGQEARQLYTPRQVFPLKFTLGRLTANPPLCQVAVMESKLGERYRYFTMKYHVLSS